MGGCGFHVQLYLLTQRLAMGGGVATMLLGVVPT